MTTQSPPQSPQSPPQVPQIARWAALHDRPILALLVALHALNFLDIALTLFGLSHGALEGNPLAGLLFAPHTAAAFLLNVAIKIGVVVLISLYILLTQYRWWRFAALVELVALVAAFALFDLHSIAVLMTLLSR